MIRVRILASGQVIDMVPEAAITKINAGIAVRVEPRQEFALARRVYEVAARFCGAR